MSGAPCQATLWRAVHRLHDRHALVERHDRALKEAVVQPTADFNGFVPQPTAGDRLIENRTDSPHGGSD